MNFTHKALTNNITHTFLYQIAGLCDINCRQTKLYIPSKPKMNGERKGWSGCIQYLHIKKSQHEWVTIEIPKMGIWIPLLVILIWYMHIRHRAVPVSISLFEGVLSISHNNYVLMRDKMMIRVKGVIGQSLFPSSSFPFRYRHLCIGILLSIWHILNQRQKIDKMVCKYRTCFKRWDASLWWFECTVNAPTSHFGSWGGKKEVKMCIFTSKPCSNGLLKV